MVKEWCDILCFCKFTMKVVEDKSGKAKAKGVSKRMMFFKPDPTFEAKTRYEIPDSDHGLPMSFEPLRPIYEGNAQAEPEHTMLQPDSPHEGIVEDDNILEDPRDVLIRRLNEAGVDTLRFEAWLVATGRLAPGGHYTALSGTTAQSMITNMEILLNKLKGDKK